MLCTPAHYLACTNLFRMDADGGGLRPLSHGALSEFTPTMMEDGRILYNRWEYVYKGIAAIQPLWTTRPDGSGGEEFFGDNVANPGVFWQARQVPGHPRLAVCIGCGHEPLGVGQVLLLDLNKNKRTPEPITNLTPDVKIQNLRGIFHLRNGVWREDFYGPLYSDPYPLSDKFFLVSCNPDRRYNDRAAYGIHLLDVFGNRVPIYHDAEISSWQPMPLRPAAPPLVRPCGRAPNPVTLRPARRDAPRPRLTARPPRAEPSVPPPTAPPFRQRRVPRAGGHPAGTVKYLRVLEQIPKPWSAEVDQNRDEDRSADGFGGHLAVTWNAHIWVAVLHGIVPVQADGSARFKVPAGRNLFFQALDENLHGSAADADVRQLPAGRGPVLHRLPRASHAGPGGTAGAGLHAAARGTRGPARRRGAAPAVLSDRRPADPRPALRPLPQRPGPQGRARPPRRVDRAVQSLLREPCCRASGSTRSRSGTAGTTR